jgi:CRP/FNR family transcriptional regulator
MVSHEIVRKGNALLLGTVRAEERVAGLLLDLVRRLQARGYSACEMVLKMSRLDMASYLCIKYETLGRTFAKLVETGVLEVDKQQVRILNVPALQGLASAHHPVPA